MALPGAASFPRHFRLTRTDDFSSVFGFRRAIRGQLFMLHYFPRTGANDAARLGLVVGKKFMRRAVSRNLVRRLVRERFRQLHDQLSGYDVIVRVLVKPARLDRKEIVSEIDGLFAKLRPRKVSGDHDAAQPRKVGN